MISTPGRRNGCRAFLLFCCLWIFVWAFILAVIPSSVWLHLTGYYYQVVEERKDSPINTTPSSSSSHPSTPIPHHPPQQPQQQPSPTATTPAPPRYLGCGAGTDDPSACTEEQRRVLSLVTVRELPNPKTARFCLPKPLPENLQCDSRADLHRVLGATDRQTYCIHFYAGLQPPPFNTLPQPGAITVVEDSIFQAPFLVPNTMHLHFDSYKALINYRHEHYRRAAVEWNDAPGRPSHIYEPNELPFVFVIRNAVVSHSHAGSCDTVFSMDALRYTRPCGRQGPPPVGGVGGTHFKEPVFYLDQPWAGNEFGWHGLVENFLRAAPFVEEIKASNMTIIGVAYGKVYNRLWEMFGISPAKVQQQGPGAFSADLLYLPNYSGCGVNTLVALRAAQQYCKRWVEDKLSPLPDLQKYRHNNRTIVIVKRTNLRVIKNHDDLMKALAAKFEPLGYKVQEHLGTEGIDAHAMLFYQARVLIAPHGAGMSMLFCCRPGTFVMEVTHADPNLCYAEMGFKLAHDYHFMTPVNPPDLQSPKGLIEYVVDIPYVMNLIQSRLAPERI